jgi:ketosteroid isomerase-like protein
MKIYIWLLLSTGLFSCEYFSKNHQDEPGLNDKKKNWQKVEELKNTDREFSAYCRDSGLQKAFLEYLDEDGVLLRPSHLPMEGANAFEFLSQFELKDVEMNWSPVNGDIAASGDLGYTYGLYQVINNKKADTVLGTYVFIWKKQKDGNWKLVLDSGNSGLDAQPGHTAGTPLKTIQ